jgi:hypothetical protein
MQANEIAIRIALPVTEAVEVLLEPRSYLSRADQAQRLSGRMSIGVPILTPIPTSSVDAGVLTPYLAQEELNSAFYLLHLVVNLRPDNRAPFEELGVGVALSCPASTSSNAVNPIAWSLSPLRATEATGVSTTLGLTGKLGIVEPQATRTVAGMSEYVVGVGERESDFEWRFTATNTRPLTGAQPMYAVIKAPSGIEIRANIVVSASVRLSKLGLIPYRPKLSPLLKEVVSPAP